MLGDIDSPVSVVLDTTDPFLSVPYCPPPFVVDESSGYADRICSGRDNKNSNYNVINIQASTKRR